MKKLFYLFIIATLTMTGCSEKQIEENIIVKEEMPEELLQSYDDEGPAIEATVITPEQEEIEVEVKNNKLYVDNSVDKEKMEEIAKMFLPKVEVNESAPSEPVEESAVEQSKDLTVEETPEVIESSVTPEIIPEVATFDNTGWFSKRPDGSILTPMKVVNVNKTIAEDGEVVYHAIMYDHSEFWSTENWEDRIQSTSNGTTFPYWKDSVTFRVMYSAVSGFENRGITPENEQWSEIYSMYLDGILNMDSYFDETNICYGITVNDIESLVDCGIEFGATCAIINQLDGDVEAAVSAIKEGARWSVEAQDIVWY